MHQTKIRYLIFFMCILLLFFGVAFFLRIVIAPLILAFIGAYLVDPIFEVMEKRGFQRKYAALIVLAVCCILAFLAAWILLPVFIAQMKSLLRQLPAFNHYMESNFLPQLQHAFTGLTGNHFNDRNITLSDILPIDLTALGNTVLSRLGASTRFLFSLFLAVILTPLFAFFFMRDFRKLYRHLFSFIPLDLRGTLAEFAMEVDKKLRAVLRGQFIVIFILCCLYPLVFLIAGLPSAIAVGVLTGLARLIPYMDIVTGIFLCFFAVVTNGGDTQLILWAYLAFATVQAIDAIFITPRIMGQFSGLHPFLVILSVLCFGDWFGFYGVLLAVPLASVARVAIGMIAKSYKESSFFNNVSHR